MGNSWTRDGDYRRFDGLGRSASDSVCVREFSAHSALRRTLDPVLWCTLRLCLHSGICALETAYERNQGRDAGHWTVFKLPSLRQPITSSDFIRLFCGNLPFTVPLLNSHPDWPPCLDLSDLDHGSNVRGSLGIGDSTKKAKSIPWPRLFVLRLRIYDLDDFPELVTGE